MTRFKDTKVDTATATVEVGAGLTWDPVYAALESYGITVVGGRIPGVGVAGLTLGGGSIVGFELVLPNASITSVTADDADLWFALRGGLNNFGIVTKFILKSYPQEVWGGSLVYPPDQLGALKDAIVRYQEKDDVKAAATFSLIYSSGAITPIAALFYDASTPAQGIFDDFVAIPTTQKDLSSRSLSDLVLSLNFINPPSDVPTRTYVSGIPVTRYSAAVIDTFVNQINGEWLDPLDKTLSIAAILEPFDSKILSHGSGTAYPPNRSQALFPSALVYTWSNISLDHTFALALRNQSDAVHSAALADGQNLSYAAVYVNYALFDTPLEDMYGRNVPKLREIKAEIDPEDVMGLAGEFKL